MYIRDKQVKYVKQSNISDAFKFVAGFWKTDQIVTLGLFHFIGPANGYTCTLHSTQCHYWAWLTGVLF